MSYLGALKTLASSGGAPTPPASLGQGKPPDMPNLPPPPTDTGPMPTGTLGSDSKVAVDTAVLALREVQSFAPSLQSQIDGLISQLKELASAKPPAPPAGEPSPPGSDPPATPPTQLSGSDGTM